MTSHARSTERGDLIKRLRDQAGAGGHRWTDVMRLLLEAADALEGVESIRTYVNTAKGLADEIEKQIEEAAEMGEPPSFALDRHHADWLLTYLRTVYLPEDQKWRAF